MASFKKEMKDKIDLINKVEKETYDSLKDFQKATVDRIDSRFREQQNRILVADEVGMGKTMIAKGTIAKVAKLRLEEKDPLFKVVYICSNQAIAKQNIRTLDLLDTNPQVEDTRLSMQHYQVMRQENDENILSNYIQLIPLTPGTSFDTTGGGNVNERALICAVLELAPELQSVKNQIRRLFMWTAGGRTWSWQLKDKENALKNVMSKLRKDANSLDDSKYKKNYPFNIINELKKEKIEIEGVEKNLFKVIKETCAVIKNRNCYWNSKCWKCKSYSECKRGPIISALRKAFAKISTDMLNPDLIIMDEFQRFNSLIKIDNDSDAGMLAQRFLQEHSDDEKTRTRVLLLSATPYKLFTTMEELNDSKDDDPYKEFFTVMDFLFENNKNDFQREWIEYSECLRTAKANGFSLLIDKKNVAEAKMYDGVCRTERLSVMDGEDYIDVIGVKKDEYLKITKGDIESYIQAQNLINECGKAQNVPIDYIKSCPFIMSFMENYILKKNINSAFTKKIVPNVEPANKPLLWLEKDTIEKYEPITETNARLTMLKEIVFKDNSEKLLWCPPTKPYYKLEDVYSDLKDFSKTLIFSSWEMVPKMISTLISYEEERKIRAWKTTTKKNYSDYKKGARLTLDIGKLGGKQLFSEIYPSSFLADLYEPIKDLNESKSLDTIKTELEIKIQSALEKLKSKEASGDDNDWYIAALLLLDDKKYVENWLEQEIQFIEPIQEDSEEIDDDNYEEYEEESDEQNEYATTKKEKKESDIRFKRTIEYVQKVYKGKPLGKQPADLAKFLVNVALASFATCFYRTCKNDEEYQINDVKKTPVLNATIFGRTFIRNFNTPESMEVLDYVDQASDEDSGNYLNRVYKYCINGCFQGMLDEYIHLLKRGRSGKYQEDVIQNLDMLDTASYEIDTFKAFKNEVEKKDKYRNERIKMRSHFAVCFSKTTEKSAGDRRENLRNAFNSPLRPFVLASTSVGQEGLDFHNYCRKIMHWNLPSNPIDLEQREGRINRYKCLAIRQNVAALHGDINFLQNSSIWDQMFEEAKRVENNDNYSELIPFWVFGKNQKIKIERIVPIYPMSSDILRYERLIKILSLYRMTLGQPRQEELLEYVFENCNEDEIKKMKDLFIDLSPWSKNIQLKKNINC